MASVIIFNAYTSLPFEIIRMNKRVDKDSMKKKRGLKELFNNLASYDRPRYWIRTLRLITDMFYPPGSGGLL